MNYFINGRYIKSNIINKAIEEAYKPYTMTHRYPFTSLELKLSPSRIDVNVHPAKMEIRISNQEEVFQFIYDTLSKALSQRELIPEVEIGVSKKDVKKEGKKEIPPILPAPEPFEVQRKAEAMVREEPFNPYTEPKVSNPLPTDEKPKISNPVTPPVQLDLFEDKLLSKAAVKEHRIIGQVFLTYWLVEYKDKLFFIDQHAAHEKVLFERTLKATKEKTMTSQRLSPPLVISLTLREEEALKQQKETLAKLGFEIEPFGGKEYSVRAVPADLYGIGARELLLELIDSLVEEDFKQEPELVLEKVASMSCKAAVKGNYRLSELEVRALIDELMTLENPYHCPHGRPVIVAMTKQEMEKKFKRIV
jgi:DNA mismatch repair protein MutL